MSSDAVSTSFVPTGSKLRPQDLSKLNLSELTPLSPEVISRQATINIGTIGHVAHGKSTVVKAISGVQTVRFKNELERNITIKLGYANAKIYKCSNAKCPRPACYRSYGSNKEDNPPCENCNSKMNLLRHVSFVDCFGPETEFAAADGRTIVNKDLKVGDELLGPDGGVRTVLTIKEGEKDLYEISCAKGTSFTCTGGHILCLRLDTPVESPVFDSASTMHVVNQFVADETTVRANKVQFRTAEEAAAYFAAADKRPVDFELTVESYLAAPETIRNKSRMYVAPAMQFEEHHRLAADLTVGSASAEEVAWVAGLWLAKREGAESTRFVLNSKEDAEIVERLSALAGKMGLASTVTKLAQPNMVSVSLTAAGKNLLLSKLKELGMLGRSSKSIPTDLSKNTVSVRRAVVAGLIDANGSVSKGQFAFEESAGQLVDNFVWMLRSLGFVSQVAAVTRQDDEKTTRRVHFTGAAAAELPIVSSKKRSSVSSSSNNSSLSTSQKFDVKLIGQGAFRGFEVDGDGRVLLSSFVVAHNCPGHDILMATMLNGAAVMDAAFLLIAGNESCPQPQTSEHLAAIEIMKLRHIIILQNKIDLIKETAAQEQYQQILNFVKGTVADGAPIIPISAQLRYNVDTICEYIVKRIPVPVRDFKSKARLIVIRSFDVNKPGSEVDILKGGVAGGSILRGVLKLGDEIEVRPGIVSKDAEGKVRCRPIFSKIVSLFAETNDLQFAVPGGLIGVGTKIDPTLCRADRLVGQVLGAVGELPPIFTDIEVNYFLLRRLLGVKTEDKKQSKVQKLAKGEVLMVNIGSTSCGGKIVSVKNDLAKIALTSPACTEVGEKIALSRRIDKHWRLIGWGQILKGTTIEVEQRS